MRRENLIAQTFNRIHFPFSISFLNILIQLAKPNGKSEDLKGERVVLCCVVLPLDE